MHRHCKLNFPIPNGNLGVRYHLEDWAHPSYAAGADKGVPLGVYLIARCLLIATNPDKAQDADVQGAVQTSEIIPDA